MIIGKLDAGIDFLGYILFEKHTLRVKFKQREVGMGTGVRQDIGDLQSGADQQTPTSNSTSKPNNQCTNSYLKLVNIVLNWYFLNLAVPPVSHKPLKTESFCKISLPLSKSQNLIQWII